MAHVMHYEEFEGGSRNWYCTDVKDFKGGSGYWWHPARMLGIPLTDFILMLKDKFKVDRISYNREKDVLVYSWDNKADVHKFVLFVNAEARKRNYMVGN